MSTPCSALIDFASQLTASSTDLEESLTQKYMYLGKDGAFKYISLSFQHLCSEIIPLKSSIAHFPLSYIFRLVALLIWDENIAIYQSIFRSAMADLKNLGRRKKEIIRSLGGLV